LAIEVTDPVVAPLADCWNDQELENHQFSLSHQSFGRNFEIFPQTSKQTTSNQIKLYINNSDVNNP
jgi:hypothetical protein